MKGEHLSKIISWVHGKKFVVEIDNCPVTIPPTADKSSTARFNFPPYVGETDGTMLRLSFQRLYETIFRH